MDGARAPASCMRFQPTILLCTPSYALYLGRMLQALGADPRYTTVRTLFVAGEPGMGIAATRERIQDLWGARLVEFYGCTEASPHVGGFSCAAFARRAGRSPRICSRTCRSGKQSIRNRVKPQRDGERGLTVCTNLNSESSPQLRFLVGDYATFDRARCPCGRSHVRAVGSFAGRADDLINLRGIKMFPGQIEHAVRSIEGIGDEFEIVLVTNADGLDVMTVRVEHRGGDTVAAAVTEEIRTRCEVRAVVEVLTPGTLPRTEFKAARVQDRREKRGG